VHVGSLHLAFVVNRRMRRIVVRAWRERPRAGGWVAAGVAPLRVRVGRDADTEAA
jgi:hypothetical protein